MTTQQDYWESETYAAAASFAPHLFMRLIGAQMLDLLDTKWKKDNVIEQIVRMTRYGTTREDGT